MSQVPYRLRYAARHVNCCNLFAKSEDPDQMPQHAASDLGLHGLSNLALLA